MVLLLGVLPLLLLTRVPWNLSVGSLGGLSLKSIILPEISTYAPGALITYNHFNLQF